ncbi:hypothetical protein Q6A90_04835 [Aliarcobacter skirrowii]|uniref:hypothetical protein n=1 Tax=Aliarcobacter skirrowii TaxID=28200 RepID=UPI0029AAD4B1|nr:hypothetical protein [Aliarcobacter skirrowii]MDX4061687.1 hypothetical protein [Aliarcobacter skirrowii]
MKKVLFLLSVGMVFAFANNQQFQGCIETKLSETTSILSCANGDYKATFKLNGVNKRSSTSEVVLEKITDKE